MKKCLYILLSVLLLAAYGCSAPIDPSGESTVEVEISEEEAEISVPEPLGSECTYVYTVPFAILLPDYKITQGGTTDGVFFYQDFHKNHYESNQARNLNYIVKYNVETGEKVLRSSALSLNHANDMTLNPNTGYLYVVHNKPNYKRISVLETEQLTLVDSFDIEFSIFALDYNAARNKYVAGLSGGQSFIILNDAFEAVSPKFEPCPFTASHTTQGVACDNDFIYFVLYQKGNNVVTVYDWNGNFVNYFSFDVGTKEPENITSLNGVLYIGCGSDSGLAVYRCIPEGLKEEETVQ